MRPELRRTPHGAALTLTIVLSLAATSAWPQVAGAAPPAARMSTVDPSAEQIERRLETVRTLVEHSSAARQIEASGNAKAAAQRAEARQFVRLAEEAHAARDERSAAALLDNASRQMLDGTRLASGESGRASSAERAAASRIEAAEALLAAQRRISREKPTPGAEAAAAQIEQLVIQAREHKGAGRHAEAQQAAQKAYLLAKASVGSMRGGDTLVRSLNFANKEEEFHYEIDRYETHRMLHELLASKQGADSSSGNFVAKAAELRRSADVAAQRGDHAQAVRVLEDATRELVRAIRAAGVFIPG